MPHPAQDPSPLPTRRRGFGARPRHVLERSLVAIGVVLAVMAATLTVTSSPASAESTEAMLQLGGELGQSFLYNDAVAMTDDGNTAVVAQYEDQPVAGVFTSVRVLDWNGSTWVQRGQDITGVNPDLTLNTWGAGVAIDGDGSTIAVAAPGDNTHGEDSGVTRVFDWTGSAWAQRGDDLVGYTAITGDVAEIQLSGDGNTVVTGSGGLASNDYGNAQGVQIRRWNGTGWVLHSANGSYGVFDGIFAKHVDVNADGTILITGDPSWGGITPDTIGWGLVAVWRLNVSTSVYDRIGYEASIDSFGADVASDASGTTFIAGSLDGCCGYARVLQWSEADGLVQRGSQIEPMPGDPPWFGSEVAMSADGDTVMVSAPRELFAFDDDGWLPPGPTVVRIYDWDATAVDWVQRGQDLWGTDDGSTSIGRALDVDADGDTVIIGDFSGPARVYRLATVETPAAPTGVSAVASDGTATVSWTPADSGGAPIVATTIEQQADGSADWLPAEVGDVDPAGTTVTGLTNGTGYRFRVTVANQEFTSVPSAPSELVTPTAPPIATVTTVDPITNADEITFTVTFDQPLSAMGTDVTVTGTAGGEATATTTTADGFTVTVAGMTADGDVTVTVPASSGLNANGQGNAEAGATVRYDATDPTVGVAASTAAVTNTFPIEFTVTASEPLAGFDATSVRVAGIDEPDASVTVDPTSDPTVWIASVDATTALDGTITLEVPAGSAVDEAGNSNAAAAEASVVYDSTAPGTATIAPATDQADTTNDVPVSFEIAFPETPVGFDVDDLAIGGTAGATDAALTGGPDSWTVTIDTLTTDGTITVEIPADTYTDTAGNLNATSNTATITYDTTAPVIEIPSTGITAQTDPGEPGAVVDYTVTATDPTPGASTPGSAAAAKTITDHRGWVNTISATDTPTDCTPASGSFFTIGTTMVECAAVDAAGNGTTATFVVEVVDDEAPVIAPTDDLTIMLGPGATSGAVDYPVPTATDNSGTATVDCDVPVGETLPVGSHTVTCAATDPSDNITTASFEVHLVSATPPTASTPASSGPLPTTGSDTGGLVHLAVLTLAAGAVLAATSRVARGRPRAHS